MELDIWILIDDVTDAVNYNKRMQAFCAKRAAIGDKVLYLSDTCRAHALHNIIVRVTREQEIIGRLHAQQFIHSIGHRRRTIFHALDAAIEEEMVVEFGQPDPTWRQMAIDILAQC